MPKKHRYKTKEGSTTEGGDVFRNQFVSGDGSNPAESLRSLQEIFNGKVDGDVVQLVFSECGFNVEQALESLFTLTAENDPLLGHRGGGALPADFLRALHKPPRSSYHHRKGTWDVSNHSSDSSSANESDAPDLLGQRPRSITADVICHRVDRGTISSAQGCSSPLIEVLSEPRPKAKENLTKVESTTTTTTHLSSEEPPEVFPHPKVSWCLNGRSGQSQGKRDSPQHHYEHIQDFVSSSSPVEEASRFIHDNPSVIVVLRGLPGSGKTTLANQLLSTSFSPEKKGVILSADDYFTTSDGVYHFSPLALADAHIHTKERTKAAMQGGLSPIIVDNTNVEGWEILPYLLLSMRYHYLPLLLEPQTAWRFQPSELRQRNVHGVPKETIVRMLDKYEHGLTVEELLKRKGLTFETEPLPEQNLPPLQKSPLPPSGTSPQGLSSGSSNSLQSRSSEGSDHGAEERGGVSSSSSPHVSKEERWQVEGDLTHLGIRSLDELRLMVQDSDDQDSLSQSRRTSASSSQDTSAGWEFDEEFVWTKEQAENIKANYSQESTQSKSLFNSRHPMSDERAENLLEEKGASMGSNDWLMPNYPSCASKGEVYSEAPPLPAHPVLLQEMATLTEVQDWTFLAKQSLGVTLPCPGEVTYVLMYANEPTQSAGAECPIKEAEKRKQRGLVFDKSTSTTKESGLTLKEKLYLLETMFGAAIAPADLEHVLETCSGDHQLAINNIFDFGVVFNDPDAKEKVVLIENPAKELGKDGVNSDEVVSEKLSIEPATQDPQGGTPGMISQTMPPANGELKLVLTLDPAFALQLEELFGTVTSKLTDILDPENLHVSIDASQARVLHQLWLDTLNRKRGTGSQDASKAWQKPFEMNPVNKVGMSLEEIMASEASFQTREQERAARGEEDLATRLKRQKLHNLFPGVDRAALDDIFAINKFSLPHTLIALEEALGHGPNGTPLFSSAVSKEMEEELVQMALLESGGEKADDTWQTWVDQPDLGTLPDSALEESSYWELRGEADLHHRMRAECFAKAEAAYKSGMKTVASFYSQQGHAHTVKLKEANGRAADRILELRNSRQDPNVLDLHGLHTGEAVEALKEFLSQRTKELLGTPSYNKLCLYVVTGRGLNSRNNQPKLRPVIQQFLQNSPYKFEAVHEGLFKVVLT